MPPARIFGLAAAPISLALPALIRPSRKEHQVQTSRSRVACNEGIPGAAAISSRRAQARSARTAVGLWRRFWLAGVAMLLVAAPFGITTAATETAGPHHSHGPTGRTLVFEANGGQADPEVRFVARGAGYTAFLT